MLHLGSVEYLFEGLRLQEAVGEPGKRIIVSEARGLLLRAPLFGEIGAAAAKALKVLEVVVDRTPADRPPPLFAIRRRGPHAQFGKRRSCRQCEAQRAFAVRALRRLVEQHTERATGQVIDRASHDRGDRARHIGKQAATIGFPEPALPGFLIVGQNFLRAGLDPPSGGGDIRSLALDPHLTHKHRTDHGHTQQQRKGTCRAVGDASKARPDPDLYGQQGRSALPCNYRRGQQDQRNRRHRTGQGNPTLACRPVRYAGAEQGQRQHYPRDQDRKTAGDIGDFRAFEVGETIGEQAATDRTCEQPECYRSGYDPINDADRDEGNQLHRHESMPSLGKGRHRCVSRVVADRQIRAPACRGLRWAIWHRSCRSGRTHTRLVGVAL